MEIGMILILICAVFLLIIGLKLLKNIISSLFLVFFLLIILFVIGGYFVVKDVSDLKENFFSEPKTILVSEDKNIIHGFEMTELDLSGVKLYTLDELNEYQKKYNENDLSGMLGNNYKLIIIEKDAFEDNEYVNRTIESGPLFIFQGFRLGKVSVYPETALFKAIRYLIISAKKAKELVSR